MKKEETSKGKKEAIVTDISNEYFVEDGLNKVKITELNGKKVVSERVILSEDE